MPMTDTTARHDVTVPEEQAGEAERRGDVEQAMGWFADSMRLRDVIQVVSSIEIPLPASADGEDDDPDSGPEPRLDPPPAGDLPD